MLSVIRNNARLRSKALLLLALVGIMLLSACAGPKPVNKHEQLRRELKKWESFDSQGIAEMSYMGLSLRKMFFAAKNKEQLRLDIIDGGLMGAGAKPLLSFYMGSYVSLSAPMLPILEMLNPSDMIPANSFGVFANADTLFARYGHSIIETRKLELEGIKISFMKDYRLDNVIDTNSMTELKAIYKNNSLSELIMKGPDNLSVRLIFDEIKYLEPQIIPLPKPTSGYKLDNSSMYDANIKQLLKDFLRNKR